MTTSAICSPRRNPPTGTPILSTGWCSGAGSATWCFPLTRRPASTSWRAPSPPQGGGVTTARRRPSSGWTPTTLSGWRARLEAAAARVRRKRLEPGPLSVPAVLDELRARKLFGASTLEGYALCSYRWFVQHELNPQTLEPEPEARAQGSVIHAVLEELYRDPPGGAPLPRPETLREWRRRAGELIGSHAGEHGLGGDDARGITSRARMVALIDGFLEREAAGPQSIRPDRELLEASFGEDEGNARPPLELEGFGLHGKIDRVDVPASGEPAGLIRDYKVSRTVTAGAKLDGGGQAPAPALRPGPRATVAAAAARRPLSTPGGHGQPPSPRDRTRRRGGRVAGRPRPVRQRPARRRRFRRRPRRRGRARRADRRGDAQRRDHPQSDRRSLSFVLHVPGHLPSGAIGPSGAGGETRKRKRTSEWRAARADGARARGGRRCSGQRPACQPRRPSSGARSRPATATSCWRRARAPARLGCWWSATARPPRRRKAESTRSSPLRSPSARRRSCGTESVASSRAGRRKHARRATASARHASQSSPAKASEPGSPPSTASAGGCWRPTPSPSGSTRASACSTRRRRTGSRSVPSMRRSKRCSAKPIRVAPSWWPR